MAATILVVDDEVSVAQAVRSILSLEGHRVLTAHNGVEALEAMRKELPDLIISDIMMPVMNGYEFYQAVQQEPRWRTIPFIFLTVVDSHVDTLKGKALGVDAYLTKPMVPDELLATVQGKLRRHAALREEWEELEKIRREIIAMLSHEFRTPLSTLKAAADLLLQREATLSAADLRELYEHIQKGGDRLEELVEDFLLTARIETGAARQDFQRDKRSLDLLPVLEAIVAEWRLQVEEAQLDFQLDLPQTLPHVEVAAEQVKNAVGRLLSNAVKFNRLGGAVALSVSADEKDVRITVADTGSGIPSDDQEDIFKRFVQLNRETQEQQGAGLGLAIARGLAQINGGALTVESQVGEGSRFTLSLPVQKG